ncbi:WAT1-related protein At3g30340 [Cajanus cajan]|uniref:WAT1-related protein n=1 Tax=Cajanus cajan TaxID=3821 RepID=A0A151TEH1_CAJCA|nr:WAT1-related protein At3g30340 [Cajanus cajan]KYP65428.1 Auxin-induced protein 5NG4 [Cajanus cajan]
MTLVKFHELWKPVLVMIIVNLALAFVNIFLKKVLNEGLDYLTILTYRQAISAIFLAPIACFYERKRKLEGHIICLLFLSALVGVTLTQYLYLIGLEYTSATFSCAFLNTVPVFTFILALPLGIEKVNIKSLSSKAKVLGTFVCIGGALLLILYKGMPLINRQQEHIADKGTATPSASKLKKWIIGSLLLTAGCLLWSSWFLIQARISKKYPCQYSSTAILSFFAAIQSAILTLLIDRNNAKWILKGKLEILTVVYSGLVGSGLCYVAMSWCVKQRGPVFTSAFTPLLQVFVAVLDFSILHEEIYLGSVAGSVLVISGTYILLWGKSKEEEKCAGKDAQENHEDEECMNNLEASPNVPSKLRPNGEQGFTELQVKQLGITVTRS